MMLSKLLTTLFLSRLYFIYATIAAVNEIKHNFKVPKREINIVAGRSSHPDLKDGGALQISLKRFQVDYYPYHLAKGDRKHWPVYKDNVVPHAQWQEEALASFRSKFFDLIKRNKQQHTPLSRATKVSYNFIILYKTI